MKIYHKIQFQSRNRDLGCLSWEGQVRGAQVLMNEIQDRYFREEN